MNARAEGLIAALDIGSSKVACLIANIDGAEGISVRGVGNRACSGVSAGAIIDMDDTEKAIRASVDQAEKMANTTINDVILSFSSGSPKSHIIEEEITLEGTAVCEADVDRVLEKARAELDPGDRVILHAFPATFAVDGSFGVKSPVGMYGNRLAVALHVITVDAGPLKNLEACVRRAHLNVSNIVLAPYASGLSAMVEDEVRMGAACIDIGGGKTGVAIFAQGALVHSETLPVGGDYITERLARALLTPFEQAERLKTLNGAAVQDASDTHIEVEVPQLGEGTGDNMVRVARSALTSVIQKELEAVFATLAEKLDASGFAGVAGKRVVLTGGVSQAEGIRDLASDMLGRHARIGTPQLINGLPQAAQNPSFATALGLLVYAADPPPHDQGYGQTKQQKDKKPKGVFGKLGKWVSENF